jgi:hypothetical protein
VQLIEMKFERLAALQRRGLAEDIGGDERIAVTVAAIQLPMRRNVGTRLTTPASP